MSIRTHILTFQVQFLGHLPIIHILKAYIVCIVFMVSQDHQVFHWEIQQHCGYQGIIASTARQDRVPEPLKQA